jgi:hypothetical protein
LTTPVFGFVVLMDQFESISKFLHISNHDSKDTYLDPPKLFKNVSSDILSGQKISKCYIPGKNIATDVSLTARRVRLSFKQYISRAL